MGQFLLFAAAGLKASAHIQEAGAQQVELKLAKREEASAARDREVLRKRRTVAILGAQAANAAAKGLQLMGSVGNISIVDAQRAGEESLIDDINTRARINVLSRRSRSIGRVATIRAGASILDAGRRSLARG